MNGFGTIGDNETYFGCGNVWTVAPINTNSGGASGGSNAMDTVMNAAGNVLNVVKDISTSRNDYKTAKDNNKTAIELANINRAAAGETNKANLQAMAMQFENTRQSEIANLEAIKLQCKSAEEQKKIDLEIANLKAMEFANGGGNTKLYIGIGVGCVALVGVLAVVLLKK